MEKFLVLREKAKQELKAANQAVNFIYPMVKDNKVLLSAVNHLFLASTSIMGSILHFEHAKKRIPEFEENFETKFQLMRTHVSNRYELDREYLRMARDLKDIIIAHNKSPIEFSRGEKFIICNDNYEFKQISPQELRKLLAKTKLFIEEVIYLTKDRENPLLIMI